MYLKPQVAERLIVAIAALLPDVADEIEQRKTSGNDEYWQGLDERYGAVTAAEFEARQGHGELTTTQSQMLEALDEDFHGLTRLKPLELAEHEDGLVHFLLSEVSDCDPDDPASVAEARSRLQKVAEQAQRCADALDPCEEECA